MYERMTYSLIYYLIGEALPSYVFGYLFGVYSVFLGFYLI
jgi:hypothetical protein